MSAHDDTREDLLRQVEELRARAEEAEAIVAAVRAGEVDAFVVAGPGGDQVFTLHGADEPYRLAVEQMNAGTATLAADGTVLYCNNRLAEIAGLPADRVVGRAFASLVSAADRPAWDGLLETGRSQPCCGEVHGDAGTAVPLQLCLSPMPGTGPASLCLVATDLTEVREREQQLRRMENMRDAAERIGLIGSWEVDIETWRTAWSPTLFELLDVDPEGFGGDLRPVLEERVHPDDRQRLLDDFAGLRRTRRPVYQEFRVVHRDGSVRVLAGPSRLEPGSDGGLTRLVGSFRDVTETRRLEQSLRDTADHYRLLAENVSDVVFRSDDRGVLQWIGPAVEPLLGWRPDELVGQTTAQYWHPDDAQAALALRESAHRGASGRVEARLRARDGHYVWVSAAVRPYRTSDGRTGMVGALRDIQAEVEAREALARSEELYRSITSTSHDAIYVQSAEGRILAWNDQASRLFGPGMQDIVSDADAIRTLGHWESVREDGSPLPFDERPTAVTLATGRTCHDVVVGFRRGGEQRWVTTSTSPLGPGPDGRPSAVAITIKDITEERETARLLAASEEQFRTLFETMEQGVVFQEPDGRISAANPAAERILGLSLDQLQGRTSADPRWRAVHDDGSDFPGEDHPAMTALRSGTPVRGVVMGVFHPQTAATRWILVDAVPQSRSGEERPYRVFTVFTDITEQRHAEAALRRSEAMRDLAEKTGRIMSYTLDLTTGRITWSRGVHAIYDLDDGDVGAELAGSLPGEVADALLAHVVPEDREVVLAQVTRTATTGAYAPLDFRIRHRDGSVRVVHSDGQVVCDEDGVPVRVVGYHQDVTEQHRAAEEIRALNAELEQRVRERTAELETATERLREANAELESFSYSVSHDLRAPLRAIDGFSEILVEDYAGLLDEDGLAHLARIRNGAQRMGRLVDDLLALSRVGRQELQVGDVDLSLAAARILGELAAAEPERCVDVVVQPGCRAAADKGLVTVLLTNLLGNAWKFSAASEEARIEVGSAADDGETAFFVRDNGAGFDQAGAERLFRPFSRLHSEQEFAGTGIGLAIVQRIVARHGGRCWAEGAPGEGATFSFTLGRLAGPGPV